ncbi:MAG: phenylacetate-CoA oxygenase subunit PaaI, partial [Calditrichaeota bacterium]|nr:phenylacetate-CoA oxygenase subunit PaaI [Calditrichota bacterium]
NGTPEQQKMVQDAVDRWWWPSLMMFGPSDANSPNSEELLKWKVKIHGNDFLRQRFVNLTVPQAKAINVTLPDPKLKLNEKTGDWEFGEINWDEFWSVVKGNGPCNHERLTARQAAHQNGMWVREAAEAYTKKHSKQKAS